MTEKQFYKEIKLAISLSVDRFHWAFDVGGDEELRKKTIRSIFNEYKRDYEVDEFLKIEK